MFFDSISHFRSLIMIHILKNWNLLENLFILLSFLLGGILYDMIEGSSIKGPKFTVSVGFDCGSSWGVIKKSQFTENVSWNILLQESLLAINDLGAAHLSRLNDVKNLSWLTLLNDELTCGCLFGVHGINDNLQIMLVKRHEHESLKEKILNFLSLFGALWNNFFLESLLNMILTEDLS